MAILEDGSNFLTPNSNNSLMAMHVNAYGISNYPVGALISSLGANGGSLEIVTPAPPGVVLLASGAICLLVGFAFRRRALILAA
jgi:hypothetical protein